MAGAIHRLEPEALALDFDRPEHAVREIFEMPRNFVELLMHDVRRHHRLIAAFAQSLADELLDDAADRRPLGVPEDEPAAGFLFDGEEIQLHAELAVIALRGLFEEGEIVV